MTPIGLRLRPPGLAITSFGGGVLDLALLPVDAHAATAHVRHTADDEDYRHDPEDQHVEDGSLEQTAKYFAQTFR